MHFDHGGKHFNLIDTPGYPDFIGQAIGALRAVETACIVVNAHSGIEVNTRRVFQEAGKAGVGRMIVISKMDTENIDFPKLVGSIQEMWGKACVPLNVPLGSGHDFKGVASTLKPPADAEGRPDERGGTESTADRNDCRNRRRSAGPIFRRQAADRRRNQPA